MSKHDYGIDLVAKKKNYDEYCAIQCKFYDEDYPVSKLDADTFLTASSKQFFVEGKPMRFSERIVVSTTDKWTSTAEDIIKGEIPPVTRIRPRDLKDSGIDWDSLSLSNIDKMKRDGRKQERLHQTEAIKAVLCGFQSADRGKLIMACGTGKTFTSLYQSIDVISKFQQHTGLVFDLIICDEAHRTTGVTLTGEDESNFVKVHCDDFIRGRKRLYMTATPRIYGDKSKAKASEKSALLCAMDDESIYGSELYCLGFSESVALGLLSDYKVIVLAVDENYVSRTLQNLIASHDSELILEDPVKVMGCLNGLSKRTIFEGEEDYFANDSTPMKRAVAFNSDIRRSKKFVSLFREIQDELKLYGYDKGVVTVDFDHVDGTNSALFRKDRIDWLKADTPESLV